MRQIALTIGAAAVVLASCAAASARAEEKAGNASITNGVEPVILDEPAFPSVGIHDLVHVWTGSFFAPAADFGAVDVDLYQPELRLRMRLPIDDVVSLQVTGDFHASLYNADGSGTLFKDCPDCPLPDSLYAAGIGAQGGYTFNRDRHVFRAGERWAVLGAIYARARWEPGAFNDSITPGGSIGLGYELPGRFRIALAAQIERALDGDGVQVSPSGYLRWDITPQLCLRNRGVGLELEYRIGRRVELFATAFKSGDRFLLDDRPGLQSSPTLRDSQVLVGGGLALKIAHTLRLSVESGAIVDRSLAVDTANDGRLDTVDSNVSPYVTLRIELRP
jgi:hypothetical protein